MEQTIKVCGTRDDVLALKKEIEANIEGIITISDPTPSIPKLNARQGYRQNEIFEILISFATGIASSVAYDQCKHLIETFQKKKKVEAHFGDKPKELETKKPEVQQDPNKKSDAP